MQQFELCTSLEARQSIRKGNDRRFVDIEDSELERFDLHGQPASLYVQVWLNLAEIKADRKTIEINGFVKGFN
jgi:hypothetical protein